MNRYALSLAFVAAVAGFATADPKAAAKTASTKPAKPASMSVEVVSVDAEGKTVTIKGKTENKTLNVAADARASVMALKPGEKATLWHDASGEVTSVKVAKAPATKTSTAHTAPKASTAAKK